MPDRCRKHIFILVGIIGTGKEREQTFRNRFARAHAGLAIRQVAALPYIPVLDAIDREIIVVHTEVFPVDLKIRITGRCIQIMSSFKVFYIGEISFRSQVFRLAESQVGMPLTRIVNLASVCAGPILVQFPLTVFITDNLLVIQTRNRLDIQLQVYFRLEPFIQSVVIFQHGIRNDVIVQRFVDPHVIACFAIRIVRRAGRVVTHGLLKIRIMVVTGSLAIIHGRTDFQPIIEQLERCVHTSAIILTFVLQRDTLVLFIEERSINLCLFRTHFQCKMVFLGEVTLINQLIPPVCIGTVIRTDIMFGIFTAGQHFGSIVVLFFRKLVAVRESHFPVRIRAALGRNQDHTGGCTCSVDSTGRSIFQHIDRLDIILRQRTDIATRKTIDHDKRSFS